MNQDFTPRMQQILRIMIKENDVLPVSRLADEIGVSRRTVQRELEHIGSSLKKYHLEFKSKTGTGVWLEGSEDAKTELYQLLTENDTLDTSNRNERRKRLTLELLKDKSLKKLYYYSSMFGVSEATVSSDLEAVEEWFAAFHLKIVRRQGYGVAVEGSEQDYRKALSAFVDENLNTRILRESYEDRSVFVLRALGNADERNIYRVLDDDVLKRVVDCILKLDDKRIRNLTESSYLGLVLHVTIAINRILKHELTEGDQEWVDSLKGKEDYLLAAYIAEALEAEFSVEIPEVEIAYICLHLLASKRQMIEERGAHVTIEEEQERLLNMIDSMIDVFDSDMAYELKQDEEFIRGLSAHLEPTMIRLKNDMKIRNPMLEQIRKDYPAIFEKCRSAARVIEDAVGCAVPEEEIGFLAIHFGAGAVRLENQREYKRKVNIGVVCASGIGISRLMSSKLDRRFRGLIELETYAKTDLTQFAVEKTDFFVSSIQSLQEDADILYVSPLLPESDMKQIEERIAYYGKTPGKKREDEFAGQLDRVHYLAVQIKSIIKNMGYLKVDRAITFDELLMAVSEQLSPYNDRRAMIQEDIRRREKIGSQIFPEFGFALLHARTKGVIKPVFMVCQTRDREPFADPYLQNIQAVIVMMIPVDEHVIENGEVMGCLSSALIEEPEFLDTVFHGEKEQIREILSQILKRFFNQYIGKL